MPILERLIATPSIESQGIYFPQYHKPLSELISDKQHWPNLTTLSLRGLEATETALRQLLKRHSATLQSLALSMITLMPDHIPGAELPSWAKFLKFLNENLTLTHVKFDRTLQ